VTTVLNQTRGTVVCERTEVASNPFTRMRGLLGQSSIHSAFMRFEFDAIFMDREMRVVKLAERIKPWRALGAKGAGNILELAGGEISRLGIAVGDQLAVSDEGDAPGEGGDV
jgi:uncharacterized membrane protein (UPF0127 family)